MTVERQWSKWAADQTSATLEAVLRELGESLRQQRNPMVRAGIQTRIRVVSLELSDRDPAIVLD